MHKTTDHLGFIPRTTIAQRFVDQDLFIIQRNRRGRVIGYILHGRVNQEGTLYVHQAHVNLELRNRGYANRAAKILISRAIKAHARNILLRSTSDLQAVAFWRSYGFQPLAITASGATRRTTIIQYELILRPDQEELDSGPHREALRPNA